MATYKREEITRMVGSMEQLAYARPVTYTDGLADGLKAFVASNGTMDFMVMASKCLDIGRLSYKGTNLSFIAKPGVITHQAYDTMGGGQGVRSLMGGMCFTCGLDNVGPFYTEDGTDRPFHGRIRGLPSEQVSATAQWEGDEFVLRFSGDVRQTSLFGENLVIHRTIETKLFSNRIEIVDNIENQGFAEEEFELLYHCNTGYPLMQPGSRIVAPSLECTPRDDVTREVRGDTKWNVMDAPVDNQPEQCYYHDLAADAQGNTFSAMVNDKLSLAFVLRYQKESLPFITEWKSTASGDFALGMEPANCHVETRANERKLGSLRTLAPQSSTTVKLVMEVLEGKEAIAKLDGECSSLLK